jgi:hypothetical protein
MDFCLARGRRFSERLEKARIWSRPPEQRGVEKARECEPGLNHFRVPVVCLRVTNEQSAFQQRRGG